MSEETRFKPGQSGNPNGRPKLPDDIRQIRKVNKTEIERVMNKFLSMTKSEISQLVNDQDTPALEIMLASIIVKATTHGDHQRLNFILDRLVGKVKDVVQVELPKPTVIERLDGSSVELGAVMNKGEDE